MFTPLGLLLEAVHRGNKLNTLPAEGLKAVCEGRVEYKVRM